MALKIISAVLVDWRISCMTFVYKRKEDIIIIIIIIIIILLV